MWIYGYPPRGPVMVNQLLYEALFFFDVFSYYYNSWKILFHLNKLYIVYERIAVNALADHLRQASEYNNI